MSEFLSSGRVRRRPRKAGGNRRNGQRGGFRYGSQCDAPAYAGDSRRRYYQLTDAGRDSLGHEIETLERVVSFARAERVI